MVVAGARLEVGAGAGWRAPGVLVCWGGKDRGGAPMGSCCCWACWAWASAAAWAWAVASCSADSMGVLSGPMICMRKR